jgi:hypothetical protein
MEVAKAHIAAAERGRLGHNYILAGEPITLKNMVDQVGEILHVDTTNVRVMPPWAMQILGTVMDVVAEFTGIMPLITSEMAQLLTQDSASFVNASLRDVFGLYLNSCQRYRPGSILLKPFENLTTMRARPEMHSSMKWSSGSCQKVCYDCTTFHRRC